MQLEFFFAKGKSVRTPYHEDGCVFLFASQPIVVQPSEIMKVQTDLLVRVPAGKVLSLASAPDLSKRAAELFAAPMLVFGNDGTTSLELPIRNGGRNPLYIMPQNVLAVGVVLDNHPVSVRLQELQAENNSAPANSTPQKKNPSVRFEVKGSPNGS